MLKKIIILVMLSLKLFPGQQKIDGMVFAQNEGEPWPTEGELCYVCPPCCAMENGGNGNNGTGGTGVTGGDSNNNSSGNTNNNTTGDGWDTTPNNLGWDYWGNDLGDIWEERDLGLQDFIILMEWLNSQDSQTSQDNFNNSYITPNDSVTPKIFIVLNTEITKKYYDGDEIFIPYHPNKSDTLGVLNTNYITYHLPQSSIIWAKDGFRSASNFNGKLLYSFSNLSPGIHTVSVGDGTGRIVIQVKLVVSNKSSVLFARKNDYIGEYGFDDEGYRYDSLKNNYRKFAISGYDYNVPWMSLLDSQTATIKIMPNVTDVDLNNSSFWVEFRPSASGKITINGSNVNPFHVTGSQLKSMSTIQISATGLDNIMSYKQDSIVVVSNLGDTIGKLMVSCQKPMQKRIAFIYVNTGQGYRFGIKKDSLLAVLNQQSHNQIFKNYIKRTDLQDTLNVISQFQTGNLNADTTIEIWLNRMYRNAYYPSWGSNACFNWDNFQNLYAATDPNRTYLYFITTMKFDSITLGETISTNSVSTVVLYGVANNRQRIIETTSHEMGHALGLEHTFFELDKHGNPPLHFCPHIPKHDTKNIMDYGYDGADPLDLFYYYQWYYSNYY